MSEVNNKEFEINLSFLTLYEQYQFAATFNTYRKEVLALIKNKGLSTSVQEVNKILVSEMDAIGEDGNEQIDTILLAYPDFIKLAADYSLIPGDFYYDKFFIRKLRALNLTKVPAFFNFQLRTHHKNDLPHFILFVKLAIEEHKKELLNPEKINIYFEILSELQIVEPKNDSFKKLAIKRTANDGLTVLNLEQTVLMIALLQKEKFLLSDQMLSDTAIAELFESLTGYSSHTIRQSLGKYPTLLTTHHSKALNVFLTNLSKNV